MIAAILLAAFLSWAQQPRDAPPTTSAGSGTLTGRVTFVENGQTHPLRRATVILNNLSAKSTLVATTDQDGAYRFDRIHHGDYRLSVTKAGFVPTSAPADVAVRAQTPPMNVTMVRAAAIEGRFIDSDGNSLVGLTVTAERLDAGAGARPYTATTDDLGRFRIHTIPAGRYIVHATPPPPASGLRLFYPGTEKREDAATLTAVSGQTVDNVTVTVPVAQPSTIAAEAMAAQTLEAASAPVSGPESARITGRVTRSDNGQPIANAAMKLSTMGGRPERVRITWTDGAGEYTFYRVTAGTHTLTASLPGYTSAGGVVPRPDSGFTMVVVANGDRVTSHLSLTPLGAIEGRVVDEFGDPAPGVYIHVGTQITQGGNSFVWTGPSMAAVATDDRGRFRIAGLFPADYYAFALPVPFAPSSPGTFPITFYPGTTSFSGAAPINVAAGASTYGVDLSISATRAAAIIGTAMDLEGRPVRGVMAILLPVHEGHLRINVVFQTITGEDGRFSFRDLPEGTYILQGMGTDAFGAVPVTVGPTSDSSPQTVLLHLKPHVTVSGRFVFEGGPPPDLATAKLGINLRPTDFVNGPAGGIAPRTTFGPDGTFTIRGIASPGILIVNVPGWTLSRILLQGRDISKATYDFSQADTTGIEVILRREKSPLEISNEQVRVRVLR